MRKRNCDNLFDNIMWYGLYLLPIIIFLVVIAKRDVVGVDGSIGIPMQFATFIAEFVDETNPIIASFLDIFTRVFPMFSEFAPGFLGIVAYGTYFVAVYMVHLMVDFLLFIPRLAHKWLKKAYQGD